MDGLRF